MYLIATWDNLLESPGIFYCLLSIPLKYPNPISAMSLQTLCEVAQVKVELAYFRLSEVPEISTLLGEFTYFTIDVQYK